MIFNVKVMWTDGALVPIIAKDEEEARERAEQLIQEGQAVFEPTQEFGDSPEAVACYAVSEGSEEANQAKTNLLAWIELEEAEQAEARQDLVSQ